VEILRQRSNSAVEMEGRHIESPHVKRVSNDNATQMSVHTSVSIKKANLQSRRFPGVSGYYTNSCVARQDIGNPPSTWKHRELFLPNRYIAPRGPRINREILRPRQFTPHRTAHLYVIWGKKSI